MREWLGDYGELITTKNQKSEKAHGSHPLNQTEMNHWWLGQIVGDEKKRVYPEILLPTIENLTNVILGFFTKGIC